MMIIMNRSAHIGNQDATLVAASVEDVVHLTNEHSVFAYLALSLQLAARLMTVRFAARWRVGRACCRLVETDQSLYSPKPGRKVKGGDPCC